MISLFANPGQAILLAIQVLDANGTRVNIDPSPTIDYIKVPNGDSEYELPVEMVIETTGLYVYSYLIPLGRYGLGSYLISASWAHPDTAIIQYEVFMIQVGLPFGAAAVLAG